MQFYFSSYQYVRKVEEIQRFRKPNFRPINTAFSWCSGYHIRLTRGRSPVRSRAKTCPLFFVLENVVFQLLRVLQWAGEWQKKVFTWSKASLIVQSMSLYGGGLVSEVTVFPTYLFQFHCKTYWFKRFKIVNFQNLKNPSS